MTEWEWPRIRCEILVERESQKGIVIGKGGSVLKEVGTAVREQLAEGAYLELFVKVDKDWPRLLTAWSGSPPGARAGASRRAVTPSSIWKRVGAGLGDDEQRLFFALDQIRDRSRVGDRRDGGEQREVRHRSRRLGSPAQRRWSSTSPMPSLNWRA